MYAVVLAKGHQVRVESGNEITVNHLEGNPQDRVIFDKVLMLGGGSNKPVVGAPFVGGAKVTGRILRHEHGDKVLILKQRRRKGYRKKQGHRQQHTVVQIEEISAPG